MLAQAGGNPFALLMAEEGDASDSEEAAAAPKDAAKTAAEPAAVEEKEEVGALVRYHRTVVRIDETCACGSPVSSGGVKRADCNWNHVYKKGRKAT